MEKPLRDDLIGLFFNQIRGEESWSIQRTYKSVIDNDPEVYFNGYKDIENVTSTEFLNSIVRFNTDIVAIEQLVKDGTINSETPFYEEFADKFLVWQIFFSAIDIRKIEKRIKDISETKPERTSPAQVLRDMADQIRHEEKYKSQDEGTNDYRLNKRFGDGE
jgi:hypothetical protein